jgi:transcriptional regulator with XRE-family HTH domain
MRKKLKDVLKGGRKKKKVSQNELGKQIGHWGTYIGQMEKGERIPSDETCVKLANELDLDVKEVLLLALIERTQVREMKHLLEIVYKLVMDPVVAKFMDEEIQEGEGSVYDLVKLFLTLSPHQKRVIEGLVIKLNKPKERKSI